MEAVRSTLTQVGQALSIAERIEAIEQELIELRQQSPDQRQIDLLTAALEALRGTVDVRGEVLYYRAEKRTFELLAS